MTNAIVKSEQQGGELQFYDAPQEVMRRFTEWATVLMQAVENKKLYASIDGKKYLEVEAWAIIAGFDSAGPVTEWVNSLKEGDEIIAYTAKVNITKHGEIIASGISCCYLDDFPCRGKEGGAKHRAAQSAAQTWAFSKAARLKYSPVAVLAGYEPTPASEMQESAPAKVIDSARLCPQHNVEWFKRGNMRAFAHPLGEGKPWCNMPERAQVVPDVPRPPAASLEALEGDVVETKGSVLGKVWSQHRIPGSGVAKFYPIDPATNEPIPLADLTVQQVIEAAEKAVAAKKKDKEN